jgi:hypothetical protein
MNSVTPSAGPLAYISPVIEFAEPGDQLQTFVDQIRVVGILLRKGHFNSDAEMVERELWGIARAHGLTGEPRSGREEVIEDAIGRAVARVEDDGPRASNGPNGRDADHERASEKTVTSKTEKPKRELPRAWWRDPATIPARSSLYDGHYIRRTIGATIGGGGRAKTTRAIYEAVCMVAGFDIATKEKLPAGELRVWICNGEEDQDELDRRVAAACQRYGIGKADLGGRLFVQSVRDDPLRIATLVNNRPVVDETVKNYMTDFISANAIDVFMIDPLVSFHGVMENDNNHMDVVVKGYGAIANRTNSAGKLFHHPGKPRPGQAETTVEDSRGASAVIWAVRSARVFNFMTPEEAATLLDETMNTLHANNKRVLHEILAPNVAEKIGLGK